MNQTFAVAIVHTQIAIGVIVLLTLFAYRNHLYRVTARMLLDIFL